MSKTRKQKNNRLTAEDVCKTPISAPVAKANKPRDDGDYSSGEFPLPAEVSFQRKRSNGRIFEQHKNRKSTNSFIGNNSNLDAIESTAVSNKSTTTRQPRCDTHPKQSKQSQKQQQQQQRAQQQEDVLNADGWTKVGNKRASPISRGSVSSATDAQRSSDGPSATTNSNIYRSNSQQHDSATWKGKNGNRREYQHGTGGGCPRQRNSQPMYHGPTDRIYADTCLNDNSAPAAFVQGSAVNDQKHLNGHQQHYQQYQQPPRNFQYNNYNGYNRSGVNSRYNRRNRNTNDITPHNIGGYHYAPRHYQQSAQHSFPHQHPTERMYGPPHQQLQQQHPKIHHEQHSNCIPHPLHNSAQVPSAPPPGKQDVVSPNQNCSMRSVLTAEAAEFRPGASHYCPSVDFQMSDDVISTPMDNSVNELAIVTSVSTDEYMMDPATDELTMETDDTRHGVLQKDYDEDNYSALVLPPLAMSLDSMMDAVVENNGAEAVPVHTALLEGLTNEVATVTQDMIDIPLAWKESEDISTVFVGVTDDFHQKTTAVTNFRNHAGTFAVDNHNALESHSLASFETVASTEGLFQQPKVSSEVSPLYTYVDTDVAIYSQQDTIPDPPLCNLQKMMEVSTLEAVQAYNQRQHTSQWRTQTPQAERTSYECNNCDSMYRTLNQLDGSHFLQERHNWYSIARTLWGGYIQLRQAVDVLADDTSNTGGEFNQNIDTLDKGILNAMHLADAQMKGGGIFTVEAQDCLVQHGLDLGRNIWVRHDGELDELTEAAAMGINWVHDPNQS
eukprot:Lankesteria_metandrocarpae@DN10449_c0_g1_i1.p1